jgi:hypothetical protein
MSRKHDRGSRCWMPRTSPLRPRFRRLPIPRRSWDGMRRLPVRSGAVPEMLTGRPASVGARGCHRGQSNRAWLSRWARSQTACLMRAPCRRDPRRNRSLAAISPTRPDGFVGDAALLLLGVIFGALAAGGVEIGLKVWDRQTRRRVAARSILGDIAVAEAAFGLLLERKQWFRHDFDPALATWDRVRGDFSTAVSIADWAQVDAFYRNLARSAALARPHESATDGDLSVAEAQTQAMPTSCGRALRVSERPKRGREFAGN